MSFQISELDKMQANKQLTKAVISTNLVFKINNHIPQRYDISIKISRTNMNIILTHYIKVHFDQTQHEMKPKYPLKLISFHYYLISLDINQLHMKYLPPLLCYRQYSVNSTTFPALFLSSSDKIPLFLNFSFTTMNSPCGLHSTTQNPHIFPRCGGFEWLETFLELWCGGRVVQAKAKASPSHLTYCTSSTHLSYIDIIWHWYVFQRY